MRPDLTFALLLTCFFLSGLAGLIYETAWTREFSFVFGTSSLAIATVLAAYMGGLAFGAALAARFAHRLRRPVLAYGLLELGIAVAALAIPLAIGASQSLYVALFGAAGDLPGAGGMSSGLFYALCAFGILMVPTAMMGATLPLLARHAVRRDEEIAPRIGVLYAVNTAGAVAGTLVAAYGLLPAFGLRRTIWIAAAVNVAVFVAAWALARRAGGSASAPPRPAPAGPGRWILPLILVSGAVSFGYEVMWVRLLDHVLGGDAYAFATMLAAFLTGIALGSALASRLGRSPRGAAIGFTLAQIGTALLSIGAFFAIDRVPEISLALIAQGVPTPLSHGLLSMLTLFPGALCIGTTFPFAVRVLARHEGEAAASSARVYTANTLGSIVGSIGAGFFLIPWLGYGGTLVLCAGLNVSLAALGALALALPRARVLAAAALALAAVVTIPWPEPWSLLTIGIRNFGEPRVEATHFSVGRSSTVVMARPAARWQLATNGLTEALIDPPPVWHGFSSAERWMAVLPVLARPELDSLLLIGLGGGVTLESIPRTVGRIEVVELEPEVVAANRAIGPQRWIDPLSDPRVTLRINDARNALLLSETRFGAIVSQPSHPWTGGASNLYTLEFFELAKSRLRDDGVLVQWMDLDLLDETLFRGLLATLTSAFPFVRVYVPPPGQSAVFLASNAPLEIERDGARAIAADPATFDALPITAVEDTLARLLLDERGSRELAAGGIPNRDDQNPLRMRSSRVGRRSLIGRVESVYAELDPAARWQRADVDPFLVIERAEPRRAARLAGAGSAHSRMRLLADASERRLARAIVTAADPERAEEARHEIAAALAQKPTHRAGRAALLRLHTEEIAEGLDPASRIAAPLDAAERAVTEAWRAERKADAGAWPARDAALAQIPSRHPLARDAARLRARWRIASGERERALEALTILDPVTHWEAAGLLLRARASMAAGEAMAALDTLFIASDVLGSRPPDLDALLADAREQLEAIPRLEEFAPLRRAVEAQLARVRARR